MRVRALSIAPVKGLRIVSPASIELERRGIRGDRLLYLIDRRGRMINGKHAGELHQVAAELHDEHLTLNFPDGSQVTGALEPGEAVQSEIHSRELDAQVIDGRFAAALSRHCGLDLRLVRAADGSSAIDRGVDGAVSLISQASLQALARSAGEQSVDGRRFRMSIELDGAEAFEEDGWVGRELRVGGATVLVRGHVGRCLVTGRDPESGATDLPTLDHLREIRAGAHTTEPLALGVHGAVKRPGTVGVGDAAEIV